MYFVTYSADGRITGRFYASDRRQAANYADAVEIDRETSESAPESWAEVDVATRKLKAKQGHKDPRGTKPD